MARTSTFAVVVFAGAFVGAIAGAPRPGHAEVDWARGLVTGEGLGVADRHAPNPAVARGTSRRAAETAARRRIAVQIDALPVAGGGKVAERAKDKAVAERISRAVDHAITLDAEPQTDGAWRVTMAVPVEAVRQALDGAPRVLPAAGDGGPRVVVVEGVKAAPAVAWQVGGIGAPTLWTAEPPAWAKDAPRVAGKARAGAIEIDGINATSATLFVIAGTPARK